MTVRVIVQVRGANIVADRFRRAAAAMLGGGKATVGNTLPYATLVHEGHPPHFIFPRAKKALYWEGALHPVRYVSHPGYRGNPYLTDAATAAQPEINAIFDAAVRGVFLTGVGTARLWTRAAAEVVVQEAQQRVNVKTGSLLRDIHARVG